MRGDAPHVDDTSAVPVREHMARGGLAAFAGCESPIHEASEQLASGISDDEILVDFPDLRREEIGACLAFPADRGRPFVAIA